MKTSELITRIYEYSSENELDQEAKQLLQSARSAFASAYAPYSGFRVGAAVLLENGTVVSGSNQENAAYPSGLCAERVALFAAGSMHPNIPVKAIAIAVSSQTKKSIGPSAPCGSCRQVMAEYEALSGKNMRVLMQGSNGITLEIRGVDELLPLAFKPSNLK